MTTPKIDGSPSTVEGGDKPGANSPVDAAPPKDPDEIEALVDALASRIYEQAVATDCAYVRFAAERTALLSAVASLRARAEEAELARDHFTEVANRATAARCDVEAALRRSESFLGRMRERVAAEVAVWSRVAEGGLTGMDAHRLLADLRSLENESAETGEGK